LLLLGSVGKTSTKDAVYAVVSKVAYVRKSEKNYNSEIGLPLSILGIQNGWNNPLIWFLNILKGLSLFLWPHQYPKWLILEVGVGHPEICVGPLLGLKRMRLLSLQSERRRRILNFLIHEKNLIEEKSGLIKTLKKDGF